jgi:Secretion system C-terminal sorting domain
MKKYYIHLPFETELLMKKVVLGLIAIVSVGVSTSKAQTIGSLERQVIASSGEYLTSPSLNLSCTVGEPIVETLFNVKLILTQGFQQPLETEITSVDLDMADWSIKAFPNPFNENVNIEISSDKSSEFVIGITNLIGQNLGMEYLANHYPGKNVYSLNTAHLSTGMYIITISSKDGKLLKSFKLSKIY